LKHGQVLRAQQLAAVVAKLTGALFTESNPVPVKYALASLKMMSPLVRLPLVELRSEAKAEVDAVLAQVREGYPDYMIGGGAGHDDRVFFLGRVQRKRSFAANS
jgi:hypothetical protein